MRAGMWFSHRTKIRLKALCMTAASLECQRVSRTKPATRFRYNQLYG